MASKSCQPISMRTMYLPGIVLKVDAHPRVPAVPLLLGDVLALAPEDDSQPGLGAHRTETDL